MANISNKKLFWLSDKNTKSGGVGDMNQEMGAPLALPTTMGIGDNPDAITVANVDIIDIVENFNWTNSDQQSRTADVSEAKDRLQYTSPISQTAGIPSIILNEYRVTFSSALANLRYQVGALGDASSILGSRLGRLLDQGDKYDRAEDEKGAFATIMSSVIGAGVDAALFGGEVVTDIIGEGAGAAGGVLGSLDQRQQLNNASSVLHGNIERDKNTGLHTEAKNKHLMPYTGLYLGQPTGFKYVFPYLTSQQYKTTTNAWQAKGHQPIADVTGTMAGIIEGASMAAGGVMAGAGAGLMALAGRHPVGRLAKLIRGVGAAGVVGGGVAAAGGQLVSFGMTAPLDILAKGLALTKGGAEIFEPGAHMEETQTYSNYGTAAASRQIQIKFYLANTHSYEDVVRNWHLIYLLTYQNLPNRANKIALEPPTIYDVEIPGHYYCPFAYISSLQVVGLGNTRAMGVDLRMDPPTGTESAAAPVASSQVESLQSTVKQTHETESPKNSMGSETNSGKNYLDLPKSIVVPVPEAYEITITLTSLISDTRNLEFQALRNSDTIYSATLQHNTSKERLDKMGPAGVLQHQRQLGGIGQYKLKGHVADPQVEAPNK